MFLLDGLAVCCKPRQGVLGLYRLKEKIHLRHVKLADIEETEAGGNGVVLKSAYCNFFACVWKYTFLSIYFFPSLLYHYKIYYQIETNFCPRVEKLKLL